MNTILVSFFSIKLVPMSDLTQMNGQFDFKALWDFPAQGSSLSLSVC